ncbi:PAS domain-containing protein [Faecalicatena orotica]|uniref:PAS domain-containing hybrid sensor histidine kinase/response regulator n=1 Tax=Clostridia TaxID=186801 RepID=UPI00268FBF99
MIQRESLFPGEMEDIINAIPGGVAIYKVSDIFETVYFSDGVPELSGYTVAEYHELVKGDAADMTYWEDTDMVVSKAREVIRTHAVAEFEFRKQHRDGHIVWVRVQVKWIGEEDGCPLLHCVFHNISDFKEAQLEMEHLINSIPGGIASYKVENERFIPVFFSDGVMALSGHTREEYNEMTRDDALDIIYEPDRERVFNAAKAALVSGEVLDVSYRMFHRNGSLVWIHLNGRRMGPLSESSRFYAVFTGMSSETRLFQSIVNDTSDSIYIIGKKNYDLLYVNIREEGPGKGQNYIGQKCYKALYGKDSPCEFCTLKTHGADGKEHEMKVTGTERSYSTRFRETDWNGIPAYLKYVKDITEEVKNRKERERLEQYFQTVVKNLPGGISVMRCKKDGGLVTEFLSDGFIDMTEMSSEEAWELYKYDALAGVHPDDLEMLERTIDGYITGGDGKCEAVYRLRKGSSDYVWVKSTFSLIRNEGGESRFYAVYHDMTKELIEQEKIRAQYREQILQHYRTPDPDALVIGHCNITQNLILEIIDSTDSDLLKNFGVNRTSFFTGVSTLVVDERERQQFLDMYLNEPALEAYGKGDTELILKCFIRLPKEETGRYAQFKVNLLETPDTGDITGILTVTDITEQTISDRILHKLSVTSYDFVIDLNLITDTYTVLARNENVDCMPEHLGSHRKRLEYMYREVVVPKNREVYKKGLEPEEMCRRLEKEGSYTFVFSVINESGDIRTKNITVSAVDLRIGRICLVRTDVTDSVREQQGMLNMLAYTFELAGFIDVISKCLTLYTRQTVLENLPPYVIEHYDDAIADFAANYGTEENQKEAQEEFRLSSMIEGLEEKPSGYDFVFPYQSEGELRYKQINVLWGDENHSTVCVVRADVTDMLTSERESKEALKKALALAEEANHAKSEFLSAMSHDIRTPMNAIMGMTALATAHIDDSSRVADCLNKISTSSKHLLSLINDVLDMSKIERSQITLGRMRITMQEMLGQLTAIIAPQAKASGIRFLVSSDHIVHEQFYGDPLRMNQILLNILSNAVKFTPEGGKVEFLTEEIPSDAEDEKVRFRFTVSDSGIGMSEEFMKHLFEPFTRSSNAAQVEGTGLGLSITKGLIDLMGGSISVESHIHKGTIFKIELECECLDETVESKEKCDACMTDEEIESLFAGRRFLIAEDNAINAEILVELLAMHGAKSVVATNGAQAVGLFKAGKPGTYDAVLMDIQMPEMNGYEATRSIREMKREDALNIPIIAMTANAFAEDIQASVDAGMDAHVAKPIDIEVLRATLTRVLGDAS